MIKLKNKKIIMLGAGGHARVLYDVILANNINVYAVADTSVICIKLSIV